MREFEFLCNTGKHEKVVLLEDVESLQEQLAESKKETDLFKGKWAISDALDKHSSDQLKESQDRLAEATDSIKLILTEFDCEDGLTFQGDKVYKMLNELLATLKGVNSENSR